VHGKQVPHDKKLKLRPLLLVTMKMRESRLEKEPSTWRNLRIMLVHLAHESSHPLRRHQSDL
jgi:hypothetical protein